MNLYRNIDIQCYRLRDSCSATAHVIEVEATPRFAFKTNLKT